MNRKLIFEIKEGDPVKDGIYFFLFYISSICSILNSEFQNLFRRTAREPNQLMTIDYLHHKDKQKQKTVPLCDY